MINHDEDLQRQKDLVKTALMATDSYLGILKEVRESKVVTQPILASFARSLSDAYDALSTLKVINLHEDYMKKVIDEVTQYFNLENTSQNESVISFSNFVEEVGNDITEEDIDDIVNNLAWDDIYDLYDEDELIYDPGDEQEDIEEKISASQRIKKSQGMKRRKSQLSIARNLKLRRTSSVEVLKKRAVNAARRAVYKKLLMGRNKSQMSASEKDMLEKRMKNFKYMQNTIAIKLLPKMKAIEQSRLAHRSSKKR